MSYMLFYLLNQRVFAKEKIFEYVKQECGYIFY